MGPNNFEYQLQNMTQTHGYDTSGSSSSAGNAVGAAGAILGALELVYNMYTNSKNSSEQYLLNKKAQSNFENQFQIMSNDLQKAGFNPSVLAGGANSSTPPSFNVPQRQQMDMSGLASLLSAINESKLTKSQVKLNEAQAEKTEAESENERSLFDRQIYLKQLDHFNALSEGEQKYEFEQSLKLMQQTFDSEQNRLARQNSLEAILLKAKTDSILQKQIDDTKAILSINEAKFKQILVDKYLAQDLLKFKLGQYQDKKKFLADINLRLRQLGVEKVFKSIDALQGFMKISLDSVNSAMSVLNKIPLGGSNPIGF